MLGVLVNVPEDQESKEFNQTRMDTLGKILIEQNKSKDFGEVTIRTFDHTNIIDPLPLDYYLLDKEIIKVIPLIYDEPAGGWNTWYATYGKEEAETFYSGPIFPYDARVVLGYPESNLTTDKNEANIVS